MSNSLLSINMITREAIMLWRNSNEFIRNINMQYDDSFARSGGKIGQSLRIRLPNDYTVRTGPAASPQDTTETSTTLVVSTQKGVDIEFNSVERTMTLDDFSARVLAPMVNNLAGAVAADGMGGAVTSQWQPDLCRAAVEASAGRVYRSHGAPDGAQRVVEVALDSGKAAGEIGLDPDL